MTRGLSRISAAASIKTAILAAAAAVAVLGVCSPAGAAGAGGWETLPSKWVDQVMPEDLPPLKFPAYFNDLDKASAQQRSGRYKAALITLHKVEDPQAQERVKIALVRGRALAALGRTDEAVAALSGDAKVRVGEAEIVLTDHPDVQLARAQALADADRPREALAALQAHLKAHPDSWGGHYLLGAVNEQIGDTPAAKAAYAFFAEAPNEFWGKWTAGVKLPEFDDAAKVIWLGRAVDRWAALNEKYRNNTALHREILKTFVRARDIDADAWDAHVATAEYLLVHDDRIEAEKELKAALAANPRDAHSWDLVGKIALASFNFDKAEACVEAIRGIDRRSPTAELLEARSLLLQRRPKDALAPINRVLAVHPRHIEAMGLLASVYALQLEEDKANQVLAKVDEIDVGGDNASAYLDVAEQLSAMRQYPRAAAKYKIAIERAPWWTDARNGLGLLYTQSGDEDKAYATLTEARELDPFNIATTNYMRLLDKMLHFKKVETPHFVVMYDEQQDPLIGEYFADYLESIHAEVCKNFDYEPAVKTYIEVFPSHDAFSVRTTGSPWIGTVGASTGRVIAMVSPRRGGSNMEPFNWAQVLRHEYTHTVTLGATDNRIQHWMTEGLAVLEERSPVRWEWVPMLYSAVKKKNGLELFTMDNLTWGFVRPKRPTDRQLAYAQSWWICQYLEETYGHEAILKMLGMFRDAKRQEEVFPAVTGKSMDDFYADFVAWCNKKVDGWGYDKESSEKYKKLREQAEAAKDGRQFDKAILLWEEVVDLRPVDEMPHRRLAALYLVTKQYDKAVEQLQRLHELSLKDNRYAMQIARIYKARKMWPKSEKYALQAVYISPYDLAAHELLREVYENTGDEKGLAREERMIPILSKYLDDLRNADRPRPDGSAAAP